MDEKTVLYIQLLFAIVFGQSLSPASNESYTLFQIDGNRQLRYNVCKNNGKYVKPNCEIIYLWDEDRADFISLFNVTMPNNNTYGTGALVGKTVRVIADNMLPYITSSNYSQTLGGYLGDIWQLIENALGFKSNVSSIYYDTGLEIITSGQADVMLAAVVEKKGLLNVQYSQPYFYNWYQLFVKQPEARASSQSYLKTFDVKLWCATLIVFSTLTVTVWFTTKFLNSFHRIDPNISVPTCFLGIISGFINQGFNLKLSSYSGRMQVMFALVLGVVLYSAFNAVLVAQLAVFDIPFPFKSLDDIANKRTHSLCLRSNSFVYNNFTDENKVIQEKWKGVLNVPPCLDINNQTNLATILCKDNLVILENRVVMEAIVRNNDLPCKITNRQERLFQKGNSFLLLKGFKYKKLIDSMVKKMRSTGILQRLQDKWVRREKLVNRNMRESSEVTLDHIKGLLGMYVVVVSISLVILALEIFHHQRKRQSRPITYTK